MKKHSFCNSGNQKRVGGVLIAIAVSATFVMLLAMPDVAIEYMKKGLGLCALSVVPSLFPFMIISELIVGSGIGKSIARALSPVTKRLFGVGDGGACAFLLGTLCGFPIGARSAASMYDSGDISRDELCRVMTFCNNPSPAFVISTVGASIIGRRDVGAVIYACVVLSAVIVGILANLFMKKSDEAVCERLPKSDEQSEPMSQTFTNAIRHSALSILNVCAYVTFFGTLVGCIKHVLSYLGGARTLGALLFGFFELSSGAASAAELGGTFICAVACALFSGWSGMSVHFQIMSAAGGRGVSFKPYFLAKAAQAILCGALTATALKFVFPAMCQDTSDVFGDFGGAAIMSSGMQICFGFILASVLPFVTSFSRKNDNR